MRIAIISSNSVPLIKNASRGTEIFTYILVNQLVKIAQESDLKIKSFSAADSHLPIPIESLNLPSSISDKTIPDEKHIIFELALISKAFMQQEMFDLFHINIGDGDIALPFLPFIKKPVLITLHNTAQKKYINDYFSIYKDISNLYFVSISDAQRNFFPKLNYVSTIHHGIDVSEFNYEKNGGDSIMWAGRGIPEKGMNEVIQIANRTHKKAKLFALTKNDHIDYLSSQIKIASESNLTAIHQNIERSKLIQEYQLSKLFLFPLGWEEPFGLVFIESMACGTPIVAYAKGSIPEIVKDGETGFLVNPSDDDIRGDWIIKKTGIEGLIEAVEKIYSLSVNEYETMRKNCRKHVENKFNSEVMANEYVKVYKKLTQI